MEFARKNKVEKTAIELENINREDLRKELGKDLFEKLNRKYLGTVMNENGTYDLSKLSATDYPIFQDLAEEIDRRLKNEKDEYNLSCYATKPG